MRCGRGQSSRRIALPAPHNQASGKLSPTFIPHSLYTLHGVSIIGGRRQADAGSSLPFKKKIVLFKRRKSEKKDSKR